MHHAVLGGRRWRAPNDRPRRLHRFVAARQRERVSVQELQGYHQPCRGAGIEQRQNEHVRLRGLDVEVNKIATSETSGPRRGSPRALRGSLQAAQASRGFGAGFSGFGAGLATLRATATAVWFRRTATYAAVAPHSMITPDSTAMRLQRGHIAPMNCRAMAISSPTIRVRSSRGTYLCTTLLTCAASNLSAASSSRKSWRKRHSNATASSVPANPASVSANATPAKTPHVGKASSKLRHREHVPTESGSDDTANMAGPQRARVRR